MKKSLQTLVLLAALALPSSALATNEANTLKEVSSSIPIEETHFTAAQLDSYYRCYKRSDIQYLRSVFNAYLKGQGDREQEFDALNKFNRNYYRSKFIVCSVERAAFGGSIIQIMFQDQPDKVFKGWVYDRGGSNGKVLRGFYPAKCSNDDIRHMNSRYRQFLADKVHAM